MRLALITAALLALAACDGAQDQTGAERRSAAGEVLGGEVSDAMLPLDSVRSTSPAGPRTASSNAQDGDTAPGGNGAAPSPAIADATPTPQPAETPPPTPTPQASE